MWGGVGGGCNILLASRLCVVMCIWLQLLATRVSFVSGCRVIVLLAESVSLSAELVSTHVMTSVVTRVLILSFTRDVVPERSTIFLRAPQTFAVSVDSFESRFAYSLAAIESIGPQSLRPLCKPNVSKF